MAEKFWCSAAKETTFAACSVKSSIQIPNINTLWHAVTKNCYVVIEFGWIIIMVIRMITVCRDTYLATFIFLVVDVLIFHIVVNSNSARFCSIRFWLTLTEVVGVSIELCNLSFNFWSRWSSSSISNISPIALLSTLLHAFVSCFCFLYMCFCWP